MLQISFWHAFICDSDWFFWRTWNWQKLWSGQDHYFNKICSRQRNFRMKGMDQWQGFLLCAMRIKRWTWKSNAGWFRTIHLKMCWRSKVLIIWQCSPRPNNCDSLLEIANNYAYISIVLHINKWLFLKARRFILIRKKNSKFNINI